MSGAILETWMLAEIIKSYWHHGLTPPLYFYRDKDQKEVDLLIERDNTLYPIEFKKTASPSQTASRHFPVLEKLDKPIGHGAVICLRETDVAVIASGRCHPGELSVMAMAALQAVAHYPALHPFAGSFVFLAERRISPYSIQTETPPCKRLHPD